MVQNLSSKTGTIGAAYIVGPRNIADGTPIDQDQLERSIESVSDVPRANELLDFITFMRSEILFNYESIGDSPKWSNFRNFHDRVIEAIEKLDKWANSPMGGSSAMPAAYVSLKDWIGATAEKC